MTENNPVYILLDIANDNCWRDYSSRIGIWHTIDALDRHGFRATVPLTAAAAEHYPQLIQAGVARGWAWLASEPEAIDAIERATGTRPRGWYGPAPAPDGLDYVLGDLRAREVVLRPFASGQPLRYKYLGQALARLAATPDLCLTTSDDIAEAQLTATPACMSMHSRA